MGAWSGEKCRYVLIADLSYSREITLGALPLSKTIQLQLNIKQDYIK